MQKALTVGGETPPSHTLPPRSLRSLGLGSFAPSHVIFFFTAPLKLNPGYATDQHFKYIYRAMITKVMQLI